MTFATDRPAFSFDDDALADKKRLESFKLGGGAPQFNTVPRKRLSHGRSHSRNGSVSLSSAPAAPAAPAPVPAPAPTNTTVADKPRHHSKDSSLSMSRGSHHRRRSSVSTRRESAEMMGVTLPDLPSSHLENNVNLGDKDSVRRRALWALEGKPGADNFSPVEIPELTTPEIERRLFELPTKPSFSQGSAFSTGLSGLAGKRDSFGNHFAPSSSTKDQLHTLVEEEEEEEEEYLLEQPPTTPNVQFAHESSVTSTPTAKPRPAGLNLRPLSLTPDTLAFNPDYPSPAHSPNNRNSLGLKTLTLAASPSSGTGTKRQSMNQSTSIPPLAPSLTRRSSLTYRTDSMSSCSSDDVPRKRSSISYKPQVAISTLFGLPTPEATPTSERRTSIDLEPDMPFLHRSSEQSFLAQSHAALLARIADLERALKSRHRHNSFQSDVSDSDPNDELVQLIKELKAERDELTKDCNGWRTRVADLEKQIGALANRVDVERREAWVARERLGLVEIEKRTLVKQAEDAKATADLLQAKVDSLMKGLTDSQQAYAAIEAEFQRNQVNQEEVLQLRILLADESRRRELLERELEGAGLLNTPVASDAYPRVPLPHRWQSFGSESSTTDVESIEGSLPKGFGLGAVVEEDEEATFSDEEDNGLAGYEDELDGDFYDGMTSNSSSSSINEVVADKQRTTPDASVSATHSRSASLVRAWSFPSQASPASATPRVEEIDRFFGCLEDLENSPPIDYAPAGRIGNPFCSPSMDDEDEMPPFIIPADVGIEVFDASVSMLENIAEEDEDEVEEGNSYDPELEFEGEVDEGGIKFTFTIPAGFGVQDSPAPSTARSPSTSPSSTVVSTPSPHAKFVPVPEDDDSSFTFFPQRGSFKAPETPSKAPNSRLSSSPSSIPRPVQAKRLDSPSSNTYSPSLIKMSFVRPSLIPQPTRATKPSLVPQPRRPSQQRQLSSQTSSPVRSQPHGEAPSPRSSPNIDPSLASRSPVLSVALHSFANFIPQMPWSSASRRADCAIAGDTDLNTTLQSQTSSGFMSLFGSAREQKRGFVSKERQLERLRLRMEEEQRRQYPLVSDVCKRCEKQDITL